MMQFLFQPPKSKTLLSMMPLLLHQHQRTKIHIASRLRNRKLSTRMNMLDCFLHHSFTSFVHSLFFSSLFPFQFKLFFSSFLSFYLEVFFFFFSDEAGMDRSSVNGRSKGCWSFPFYCRIFVEEGSSVG